MGRQTKELLKHHVFTFQVQEWNLSTLHPPPPLLCKVARQLAQSPPASLIIQTCLVRSITASVLCPGCLPRPLPRLAGCSSACFTPTPTPASFPCPSHSPRLPGGLPGLFSFAGQLQGPECRVLEQAQLTFLRGFLQGDPSPQSHKVCGTQWCSMCSCF